MGSSPVPMSVAGTFQPRIARMNTDKGKKLSWNCRKKAKKAQKQKNI
jgi:hypothetical protein